VKWGGTRGLRQPAAEQVTVQMAQGQAFGAACGGGDHAHVVRAQAMSTQMGQGSGPCVDGQGSHLEGAILFRNLHWLLFCAARLIHSGVRCLQQSMSLPMNSDFFGVWLAIVPAHVVLCTLARLSVRRVDWTWLTLLLPVGLNLLVIAMMVPVNPAGAVMVSILLPLTLWMGMLMLLGRPSTMAEQLKTPEQKLLAHLAMLALLFALGIAALGLSVATIVRHAERLACTLPAAYTWCTSIGLMALALERSPRISLNVVAIFKRQGRHLRGFAFSVRDWTARVVWPVMRHSGLAMIGYANLLLMVLSALQPWPAVYQITYTINLLGALAYVVCLRWPSGIDRTMLRSHASPYLMGAASIAGMLLLGLIRGAWLPQ